MSQEDEERRESFFEKSDHLANTLSRELDRHARIILGGEYKKGLLTETQRNILEDILRKKYLLKRIKIVAEAFLPFRSRRYVFGIGLSSNREKIVSKKQEGLLNPYFYVRRTPIKDIHRYAKILFATEYDAKNLSMAEEQIQFLNKWLERKQSILFTTTIHEKPRCLILEDIRCLYLKTSFRD
jgi:hypothetical protein